MKSEKVNKIALFALFFYMCIAFPLQSQVTIGSNLVPLEGTLLDLKQSNEVNGEANSNAGLLLPRVILTDIYSLSPMLSGSELSDNNLKKKYTGMIVYNVSANVPFEKGMYEWDGSKWVLLNDPSGFSGVSSENGLKMDNGVVKLGGGLIKNTIITLGTKNLIFENGKIGVGTTNPASTLHIQNSNSIEPLILNNLPLVTAGKNVIDDAANPFYYKLRISDGGVVRKAPKLGGAAGEDFVYLLDIAGSNLQIATGYDTGGNGTALNWKKGNASYPYIELPDDGLYIFSFNFYGSISVPTANQSRSTDATSYYISAFIGGNVPANQNNVVEFVLSRNTSNDYGSYSVNIPVKGNANDKVYFKLAAYDTRFTWSLLPGGNTNMNKTSMFYWKI